ncbi:hypothetical protein DIPPA_11597, partial [Diplonema papillatum]
SLAEEAVRVISVYEAHGSPLTERSLAAALDLLLEVGLPLGEAEAFALAHEKRGIVSSEAWAVIAAGAMCRRDYNSSAVEKYAETGGSRDALIRTCLRTLLTTGGSVDLEALRLILPELPKRLLTGPDESPDPRTPVEVIGEIRAHTLAGDADYALALAEQLANEQGFVDQRKAAFGLEATLNTLLVGLYVRKARWPHALGIFEAAARQGTTPEPRTLYELCNAPGTWGPQAAPAIVEFWETCLKHNFHWVVSGCNGQPAKRDKVLARVAAALRAEHAFAETAEFERIVRASGLPVPGKPQGPNGRFSKAARRTPPGGRAPSLDAFVARGDWEAVGGLLDALAAAAGSGGWTLFEEPVLQALALLRAAKREPAARQLYRRALGARGLPPALRAAFAAAYGPVFAPGPLPPPPSRAAGRASASARSGLTAPGEKPREKSDSLLGSRGVQQVQTASVVASGLAKPHERDPAAGPERAAQYPQRKAAPFQAKGHPHRQPRSAASPDPAGFTAAGPVAPAAHAPAARSIAAAGKARRGGAVELPLIELELDEFGSSAAGGRTRSEAGQVPSTARVGTKKLRAPQREPAVEGAALERQGRGWGGGDSRVAAARDAAVGSARRRLLEASPSSARSPPPAKRTPLSPLSPRAYLPQGQAAFPKARGPKRHPDAPPSLDQSPFHTPHHSLFEAPVLSKQLTPV